MKNCTHCKYANWQKTATGRLHPSGDGRCMLDYKLPVLPSSMYWPWGKPSTPSGGYINRREELKEHCPYYLSEKK